MSDTPTIYQVGIDPDTVHRVVEWASAQPGWADDRDPMPAGIAAGDITSVGKIKAATRDLAVEKLLDIWGEHTPPGGTIVARLQLVRGAALDGIKLTFVVAADSYVGEVPVELERKLKIG